MRKPYVRYRNLVGEKFGRLTVKDFSDSDGHESERARWLCLCECGQTVIVTGKRLRSGNTKSCGCLRAESGRLRVKDLAVSNRKHGMATTPEYDSWRAMIDRCTNQDHVAYHNYGGRGIKICERWLECFENFFTDMGPRPKPTDSLDRFPDHNGNYEPGNCRWATKKEQGRNTRFNRLLTLNGVTKCLADWAEETGLKRTAITERLRRGWSVERALSQPKTSTTKNPH